jgi:HAD superfamily phosphoserine phosphatase-like hydrolase
MVLAAREMGTNQQVPRIAIFSDFNGTITDRDTLTALLEFYGHRECLQQIEEAHQEGLLSLRERIAAEARVLTCTLAEADARLLSLATVDPSFILFHRYCQLSNIPLTIVSSGIEPLITRMLQRNGADKMRVFANGVDPRPDGWRVTFRDSGPEGNAKQPYVERAMQKSYRTVAIGDDESDFGMALAAHIRFAKRASRLHAFLEERGARHYVFDTFVDILEWLARERTVAE